MSYGKTFLLQGPKLMYIQQKSRHVETHFEEHQQKEEKSSKSLTNAEITTDKRLKYFREKCDYDSQKVGKR